MNAMLVVSSLVTRPGGRPSKYRAFRGAPTLNTRASPCAISSSGKLFVRKTCLPAPQQVLVFLPAIPCIVPQRVDSSPANTAESMQLRRRINFVRRFAMVSTTVYLDDLSDLNAFDNVYTQYFGPVLPSRTTLQQIPPTERKADKEDQ